MIFMIHNSRRSRLNVIGDYIYFRDRDLSHDVIKRIDLDGSNEITIQG
jgi:hypothetical protein